MGTEVDADEPLMAAGLDSLGAVEVRNGIERSVGLELPGTLVFDYPSISAISVYLEECLGVGEDEVGLSSPVSVVPGEVQDSTLESPVFVGSICSRFPGGDVGGAVDARPLDGIGVVLYERWDVDSDSTEAPARFAGNLRCADLFDGALYGVSSTEASLMDAQQRLLLESALCSLTACPGRVSLSST
eukprot:scaffold3126_cov908-Pavlova_lutheri.AAC.1